MSSNNKLEPAQASDADEELQNPGFFREFGQFLNHNKKWWLQPLIVMLVFIGGLLVLAGHNIALAPFIYTLF